MCVTDNSPNSRARHPNFLGVLGNVSRSECVIMVDQLRSCGTAVEVVMVVHADLRWEEG